MITNRVAMSGGQERANYELVRYLACEQGRLVHIVAHGVETALVASGNVVLHTVPRPGNWDIAGQPLLRRRARRVVRALKAQGSIHILANGGNFATDDVNWVHTVHAAWSPRDEAFPWVARAKNRLVTTVNRRDERHAFAAARLLLANSELCKRALVAAYPLTRERIRVVYLGVDEGYGPVDQMERALARERFSIRSDQQAVVFIGSMGFDGRKGLDTALAIQRELLHAPGWNPLLLIAGRGFRAYWARVVEDSGIGRSVRILGELECSKDLLAASDLVVSPTRFDAYGLGVHEALCRGIPAFVSANAGVAERLPRGLSCFRLNIDDVASCARAIIDNFPLKPAVAKLLAEFSNNLRRRSWQEMAAEIASVVEANGR